MHYIYETSTLWLKTPHLHRQRVSRTNPWFMNTTVHEIFIFGAKVVSFFKMRKGCAKNLWQSTFLGMESTSYRKRQMLRCH